MRRERVRREGGGREQAEHSKKKKKKRERKKNKKIKGTNELKKDKIRELGTQDHETGSRERERKSKHIKVHKK